MLVETNDKDENKLRDKQGKLVYIQQSSDIAVGDIDTSFDSDNDHATMETNSLDSDVKMSDIEFESPKTLWLDDGLVSHVSNKPCKVTHQRSVAVTAYEQKED